MITRLLAATTSEAAITGGKGAGLVRLLSAGLGVPEAWVVPAQVSGDDDLRRTCLDEWLPTWWAEVKGAFPQQSWAVRSSAVAEDLQDASFAGVYETVLGIDSLDDLLLAVKRCWGAHEDTRAEAYRKEKGKDADGGIALVLQRMIKAEAAGVLLTANPLQPFADHVVIDAAWGLGEAVVSGRTDPDHLVLDRDSAEVISERIGAKEVELAWTTSGPEERSVGSARREIRSLTDTQVATLHGLAATVEGAIGPRRDLEWAFEGETLYVLQDRPITGLPSSDPTEVFSRKFGDEYLAEYLSPLGFDLMIPWITGPTLDELAELSGRPHLAALPKVIRHDGYAYLSGTYVLEMVRAIPKPTREGPFTEWFDDDWADRVRAVPFQPRLLVGSLRAASRDKGRGGLKQNLVALENHCAQIEEQVQPLLAQDYGSLSRDEWRRQYDEVDALGLEHFRVIRWGMGQYGTLLHGTLQKLLTNWCADDGSAYHAMIGGLPGTRTAEINRDIWALAILAREDADLLEVLRTEKSYDDCRATVPHEAFWRAFDAFLGRHGHRSSTREVSASRWHHCPDDVFGLVRAHLHSDELGTSPMDFEERAAERRLAAQERVFAAAGRGPAGVVRRRALAWVISRTQAYTVYRENQRYHLDYLLNHLHLLLLEQGRRLTDRGALAAAEDIFLLTGDQFWKLVDTEGPVDDADLRRLVDESRAHRERFVNRLPATYLFDGVATEGRVEEPDVEEGALVGLGASQGRASGPVRLVASLADLREVRHGEVLVASNIDPGWTSVFPMIAGLITETGGILSHGAILAREYGIPTVTGLVGATSRLVQGEVVHVDGTRGTVELPD